MDKHSHIPAGTTDTSRDAAESVKGRRSHLCDLVLSVLAQRPATDEEIATKLGMKGDTERPRRVELQRRGLVADTGERRRVRSGRKAIVWGLTAHGKLDALRVAGVPFTSPAALAFLNREDVQKTGQTGP